MKDSVNLEKMISSYQTNSNNHIDKKLTPPIASRRHLKSCDEASKTAEQLTAAFNIFRE